MVTGKNIGKLKQIGSMIKFSLLVLIFFLANQSKAQQFEIINFPVEVNCERASLKKVLVFNDKIYVATDGCGVWTGEDSFKTLKPVQTLKPRSQELRELLVTDMTVFKGELYCCTKFSGVYRLEDAHWVLSSKGIKDTTIWSFAVLNDKLFVSTEDHGLFSSSDGRNWQAVVFEGGVNNSKLMTYGTVFISSTALLSYKNKLFAGTGNGKVHISFDEGVTWKERKIPGVAGGIRSIYADDEQIICCVLGWGVYRSKDGGYHWEHIGNAKELSYASYVTKLDGKIWVTSYYNGGIFVYDEEKGFVKKFASEVDWADQVYKIGNRYVSGLLDNRLLLFEE